MLPRKTGKIAQKGKERVPQRVMGKNKIINSGEKYIPMLKSETKLKALLHKE